MTMDEVILRINELYRKSKSEGLTDAEKEEQKQLRARYINNVKRNLTAQLNNIVIDRPDGSQEILHKKK